MGSESLLVDLDDAGGRSPEEVHDAVIAKLREIIGKDTYSVLHKSDVYVEDLGGKMVRWVKMEALYYSDEIFRKKTSLDDLIVKMWQERGDSCDSLFYFKEFRTRIENNNSKKRFAELWVRNN